MDTRKNTGKKQVLEIKTKNDMPTAVNASKLLCRYKMDGCGHCINSQNDWNAACKQAKGKLNPGCVMAEIETKLLPFFNMPDGFKPQGFPTHAVFINGKHVEDAQDRSVTGLMQTLRKHNLLSATKPQFNHRNPRSFRRRRSFKRRRSFRF